MKNLTDWFDRVYVINCAHRPDRLKQIKEHLEGEKLVDPEKVIYYPAIIGDWTTCPADWGSGRGAWGCLRSHARIAEDVLHTRDDRDQLALKSYLVLEDDAIFRGDHMADLARFMENLPADWGQIYLGGQHTTQDPKDTDSPHVLEAISVNRTHAYAVNRPTFTSFYRHICYATDYRGTNKHIDHQLEVAHRRGDWKVYCPKKWIVGQREGTSNISGKTDETRFW